MSRTSTRSQQQSRALESPKSPGAERVLVVAILLLGVIGLAVSFGGRGSSEGDSRPTAGDSITSDGELRSDHMILNLNQRGPDAAVDSRPTRF